MQTPDDPTTPPLPYESRVKPARSTKAMIWSAARKGMAVGAISLVVGLVLVAMEDRPCHGATRSQKLNFEQRQAEIDQTIGEQPTPANAEM